MQPPFIPPATALYPLCQLEVGYWCIDTGLSLSLSISPLLSLCPLKAQYAREMDHYNPLESRFFLTQVVPRRNMHDRYVQSLNVNTRFDFDA